MPNLRLCSTFILAAVLGGCQQAPVASAPAQSTGASANATVGTSAPALPSPSNSAVGARMQELRTQVQQLKSSIDQHLAQLSQLRQERETVAGQYYAQVGEISAKLQSGTTPSNPILTQKWTQARALLDQLADNLSRVTALSNEMAVDGQTGVYLDDSTRAALAMPGALDEDHYQLRSLQADVAGSQAEIGDELTDVTNEINRQNAALGIERNNIATLAEGVRVGELLGHSLANNQQRYIAVQSPAAAPVAAQPARPASVAHAHGKPATDTRHQVAQRRHKGKGKSVVHASAASVDQAAAAPAPAAPVQPTPTSTGAPAAVTPSAQPGKPMRATTKASLQDKRAPLMVIRFDRFTERYEETLYRTVSQTLDAQPNASFRIEGVTPEASLPSGTAERLNAVRRHVEDIQRSLLAFGLTPTRISTSAEANVKAPVEEIRIYKQ
jgi:hypothetical protein